MSNSCLLHPAQKYTLLFSFTPYKGKQSPTHRGTTAMESNNSRLAPTVTGLPLFGDLRMSAVCQLPGHNTVCVHSAPPLTPSPHLFTHISAFIGAQWATIGALWHRWPPRRARSGQNMDPRNGPRLVELVIRSDLNFMALDGSGRAVIEWLPFKLVLYIKARRGQVCGEPEDSV